MILSIPQSPLSVAHSAKPETQKPKALHTLKPDTEALVLRVPDYNCGVDPEGPYTLPMELGPQNTIPMLVFGT